MRIPTNPILSLTLLAWLASEQATARSPAELDSRAPVQPRRTKSMLINPAAQPNLPSAGAAQKAADAVGLNLTDIQGDILIGMKKNQELFFFFNITNVKEFKAKLNKEILPNITTTTQLLNNSTQPVTALNIAFSQSGLTTLNTTDSLGDALFAGGQQKDASNLGDPGTTEWVPQFVDTHINGVILLASDTRENVNNSLTELKRTLSNTIKEIYSLQGAARPGNQTGHEHFGFMDGISNPAVQGFDIAPLPGQAFVKTGSILVGEDGDRLNSTPRPDWAKDGSFLVFRQLKQLVPEFNKFLTDHPLHIPGLSPQQGSDLLGARMVGRWKSGAPVELSPRFDNATLGADRNLNNNFTFAAPGEDRPSSTDQTRCPFSAHIRKTRPRGDLGISEELDHHIIRAGIPYGPEVTSQEASSNTTSVERGLAFVCYQSNIGTGFQFLQQTWADNPNFVNLDVGVDPIIGRARNSATNTTRVISGLDPVKASHLTNLTTDFVVSQGGEYFFAPSLSAIRNTLSV
ncbi:fungal peroxidase [Mycena rebaudengoi]|nr:fungal peroxidase [Mycena rebaudengoi]